MNNHRYKKGKFAKVKQKKHMPVWLVLLLDAVLAGVILLTFAFFHHVLPAMVSEFERQQAMLQATESTVHATQEPETLPQQTEIPQQPEETTGEAVTEAPEETAPPTEPDNRTEWQIRFEDHFCDEVEITENSYRSPEISITLETVSVGEGNDKITYHVADVYIASMENFVTYTANNEMRYFGTQEVMEMDEAANAILSLSGDFLTYQKSGFLMRNGEIYTRDSNFVSICVLYADGSMETYEPKTYTIDEIIEKGAVQVWSFGPPLLDENGKAKDYYNVSTAVSYTNPRSAIGYYEPGHYLFVLVDGRQNGYSRGMRIDELAKVFEERGCRLAYNLDGGGSAVMIFNHDRYSQQSNGGDRKLGDILVIRESASAGEDKE